MAVGAEWLSCQTEAWRPSGSDPSRCVVTGHGHICPHPVSHVGDGFRHLPGRGAQEKQLITSRQVSVMMLLKECSPVRSSAFS